MLLQGNLRGVQHVGIPAHDLDSTLSWYVGRLDFRVTHRASFNTDEGEVRVAFLGRDGLTLECYQLVGAAYEEIKTRTHGHIDHFAIDVTDIESALADAVKRGAEIEASTANGPVDLPTFWANGARYVFLKGPNGEKVELNQRLDLAPDRRTNNLGGWSHLGIPVIDLDKAIAFYASFGFTQVMYTTIPVDGGLIQAAMLEKNGFLLEFYQLTGLELAEIAARHDGHIDHVALDVRDVDAAFAELRTAGLEPLEPAPVPLPFWERGIKYFNIHGPNGERVEFNQIL